MTARTFHSRVRLVTNLERLMAANPDVDSIPKLSKRCFWPSDSSKRGEPVSVRTIRNVLNLRQEDQPSPSLDLIVALAAVFNVEPWELLADERQLRSWVVDKAFRPPVVLHEDGHRYMPPPAPASKAPRISVHKRVKKRRAESREPERSK